MASWTLMGSQINGLRNGDQTASATSISADGNTIAVGSQGNGTNAGYVRIYSWNGSSWAQKGATINGPATADYFGAMVALSSNGSILAIGAIGTNSVYIYDWNSGTNTWTLRSTLTNATNNPYFGFNISLTPDGSSIVIGAINGIGFTEVYTWNGSAWAKRGSTLYGDNNAGFGWYVDISSDGNTIIVGQYGGSQTLNKVRVYSWVNNAWTLRGSAFSDSVIGNNGFGISVSMSSDGNRIAFSAPFGTPQRTFVYDWNGSSWVQVGSTISSAGGRNITLSSDGNILSIGYYQINSAAGAINVYQWNGTDWTQIGTTIPGVGANDWFGFGNAVSSNGFIVAGGGPGIGTATKPGYMRVLKYTPASATAAVDMYANGVNQYITEQTTTTDSEKATVAINIRSAIKSKNTNFSTAQKTATQKGFIDGMRSKGINSFTLPSANFTTFKNTLASVSASASAKAVDIIYPNYVSNTAMVDATSATSTNYLHVEVPVNYSFTLQNGANSILLTFNGTSFTNGGNTYTIDSPIIVGDKTYTLRGIGSAMFEVSSSLTVPDAPTAVSATAGNGEATVSFTAPANNGGATILDYTVTASPGGATATGSSSPITITGLTNGTPYTFTVTARNSVGSSSPSSATSSVIPKTIPDAPTAVSATAGNGEATVSFTAPANNGGATILDYTVTASPGGATATGSSSPITITGLTNGTAYKFTVTARNSVGSSSPSSATSSVIPKTIPDAPTLVTAVAGNGEATVSFTAPANNGGATILDYTVTASPGGATATGSSSPITITGLTNGTPYTFTVTARNSEGTSSASSTTLGTIPKTIPNAPTNVVAVGGNGEVTVSFTAPANNGGSAITEYVVTVSPGGQPVSGSSSPIIVTGLTNGTSYTFTVAAKNIVGTGSATAAIAPAIPSLPVSDLNSGNISTVEDTIIVAGPVVITAKKIETVSNTVSYAPLGENAPAVAISNIPPIVQDMTIGVAAVDETGVAVVKIVAQDSTGNLVKDFRDAPLTVRVTLPGFTATMVTIKTSATIGGQVTDTITGYRVGPSLYEFTTTHLTYFSASQYVPCLVAGTRVLTAGGYKAVEDLKTGDLIRTADNHIVPFRLFTTTISATSPETAPYTIPARTFGASPAKDLTVSPYHAIQSSPGVWQIPKYASRIFDGITQAPAGQPITYYHLELPNYFKDNLVVEGTVTESYGNRQTAGMKTVYKFNPGVNGFVRMEKSQKNEKPKRT